MHEPPLRLEIGSVSKTFGTTKVLDHVALSVRAGEILGLAGQNGSGKSTLVKILTGIHQMDPGGQYVIDGVTIPQPVRWRDVHAAGISVVHQDLGLLDHLTVAENVCVGGFPTSYGRINRRERDARTAETLDRLGVRLDPRSLVGSLTSPERAEVAIARAMRDQTGGSGLVILDESTRALSGGDLTRVHELLRRIADSGSSILMISHTMSELLDVTDRLTILRDGRTAGVGLVTADLTGHDIASTMLGSALAEAPPRSATRARPTDARMSVVGLSGRRVADVDFDIAAGEVLGITGLPGSGYEDIPYLLTGAQKADGGRLSLGATTLELTRASVRTCLNAGLVLVPERRDRDGLALDQSVQDNISLPTLGHHGRPWFVARSWQKDEAIRATEQWGIRPRAPQLLIKQLSGGNQQKVLLAKWLTLKPTVMVLHEPTQAVDIGARQDILRIVQESADAGVSVVIVSSEPEDLVAACDRVLVYDGSRLVEADELTPDALIAQIYTRPATMESST